MRTLSKRLAAVLVSVLVVTLLLGLAARQSAAVTAAAGRVPSPHEAQIYPADYVVRIKLTLNISNHAPGYLIDALSAQGHGDETLAEVLGYLKAQTGAAIPDAFYQDVVNAPAGSEVFTAQLNNYAGLTGAVEISADGHVHIRNLNGSTYAGSPGYETISSQDAQFTLTVAQDADHYIYTGSMQEPCGVDICTYNYYAFAIAWRAAEPTATPTGMRTPTRTATPTRTPTPSPTARWRTYLPLVLR